MNSAAIHQPTIGVADDYRYKHFTTSLLFRDLRFRKDAAAPGDAFPKFELVTTDNSRLVNDDVFGEKPVIFIFGSMTCPMTASAAPSVQELHDEFGGRVTFIMMYVREAHPGEYFAQSETIEEKLGYARALKDFYDIQWTVAADNVDGDLHRALDPKPNSAFLMDKDGTILFRSLWASDYEALSQALDAAANGRALPMKQSTKMIGPVMRAMGSVQQVMTRGGPQAVKDLWRAGLPMALAGRLATYFSPLSRDNRGIAAVLTLAVSTATMLGLLTAWFLA
jgi:thiol-disulfide isomerase/thioredoxin